MAVISIAMTIYKMVSAPKPRKPSSQGENVAMSSLTSSVDVTIDGTPGPLPVVYGRGKIAGIRASASVRSDVDLTKTSTYWQYVHPESHETTRFKAGVSVNAPPNNILRTPIALAHAPLSSLVRVMLEENDSSISTYCAQPNSSLNDYKDIPSKSWVGAIKLGGNASEAPFAPNGSNELFHGIAAADLLTKIDDVRPQFSSAPEFQFLVTGQPVKAYSTAGAELGVASNISNSAWVLLDYLTNVTYGAGVPLSEVDVASFAAAAEICDRFIDNGATFTTAGLFFSKTGRDVVSRKIRLFECNLVVDTGKSIRDNIEKILSTMTGAILIWSGGQYKLRLSHFVNDEQEAAAFANVPTITDDELTLDQQIEIVWPEAASKLNKCAVHFRNEGVNFKEDSIEWPMSILSQTYSNVVQSQTPTSNWTHRAQFEFTSGISGSNSWRKTQRTHLVENSLVFELLNKYGVTLPVDTSSETFIVNFRTGADSQIIFDAVFFSGATSVTIQEFTKYGEAIGSPVTATGLAAVMARSPKAEGGDYTMMAGLDEYSSKIDDAWDVRYGDTMSQLGTNGFYTADATSKSWPHQIFRIRGANGSTDHAYTPSGLDALTLNFRGHLVAGYILGAHDGSYWAQVDQAGLWKDDVHNGTLTNGGHCVRLANKALAQNTVGVTGSVMEPIKLSVTPNQETWLQVTITFPSSAGRSYYGQGVSYADKAATDYIKNLGKASSTTSTDFAFTIRGASSLALLWHSHQSHYVEFPKRSDAKETNFTTVTGELSTVYEQFLVEDNRIENTADYDLAGVTTQQQAWIRAEEIVRQSRYQFGIKFSYKVTRMYLEPGDLFFLDSATLQYDKPVPLRCISATLDQENVATISAQYFDRVLFVERTTTDFVLPEVAHRNTLLTAVELAGVQIQRLQGGSLVVRLQPRSLSGYSFSRVVVTSSAFREVIDEVRFEATISPLHDGVVLVEATPLSDKRVAAGQTLSTSIDLSGIEQALTVVVEPPIVRKKDGKASLAVTVIGADLYSLYLDGTLIDEVADGGHVVLINDTSKDHVFKVVADGLIDEFTVKSVADNSRALIVDTHVSVPLDGLQVVAPGVLPIKVPVRAYVNNELAAAPLDLEVTSPSWITADITEGALFIREIAVGDLTEHAKATLVLSAATYASVNVELVLANFRVASVPVSIKGPVSLQFSQSFVCESPSAKFTCDLGILLSDVAVPVIKWYVNDTLQTESSTTLVVNTSTTDILALPLRVRVEIFNPSGKLLGADVVEVGANMQGVVDSGLSLTNSFVAIPTALNGTLSMVGSGTTAVFTSGGKLLTCKGMWPTTLAAGEWALELSTDGLQGTVSTFVSSNTALVVGDYPGFSGDALDVEFTAHYRIGNDTFTQTKFQRLFKQFSGDTDEDLKAAIATSASEYSKLDTVVDIQPGSVTTSRKFTVTKIGTIPSANSFLLYLPYYSTDPDAIPPTISVADFLAAKGLGTTSVNTEVKPEWPDMYGVYGYHVLACRTVNALVDGALRLPAIQSGKPFVADDLVKYSGSTFIYEDADLGTLAFTATPVTYGTDKAASHDGRIANAKTNVAVNLEWVGETTASTKIMALLVRDGDGEGYGKVDAMTVKEIVSKPSAMFAEVSAVAGPVTVTFKGVDAYAYYTVHAFVARQTVRGFVLDKSKVINNVKSFPKAICSSVLTYPPVADDCYAIKDDSRLPTLGAITLVQTAFNKQVVKCKLLSTVAVSGAYSTEGLVCRAIFQYRGEDAPVFADFLSKGKAVAAKTMTATAMSFESGTFDAFAQVDVYVAVFRAVNEFGIATIVREGKQAYTLAQAAHSIDFNVELPPALPFTATDFTQVLKLPKKVQAALTLSCVKPSSLDLLNRDLLYIAVRPAEDAALTEETLFKTVEGKLTVTNGATLACSVKGVDSFEDWTVYWMVARQISQHAVIPAGWHLFDKAGREERYITDGVHSITKSFAIKTSTGTFTLTNVTPWYSNNRVYGELHYSSSADNTDADVKIIGGLIDYDEDASPAKRLEVFQDGQVMLQNYTAFDKTVGTHVQRLKCDTEHGYFRFWMAIVRKLEGTRGVTGTVVYDAAKDPYLVNSLVFSPSASSDAHMWTDNTIINTPTAVSVTRGKLTKKATAPFTISAVADAGDDTAGVTIRVVYEDVDLDTPETFNHIEVFNATSNVVEFPIGGSAITPAVDAFTRLSLTAIMVREVDPFGLPPEALFWRKKKAYLISSKYSTVVDFIANQDPGTVVLTSASAGDILSLTTQQFNLQYNYSRSETPDDNVDLYVGVVTASGKTDKTPVDPKTIMESTKPLATITTGTDLQHAVKDAPDKGYLRFYAFAVRKLESLHNVTGVVTKVRSSNYVVGPVSYYPPITQSPTNNHDDLSDVEVPTGFAVTQTGDVDGDGMTDVVVTWDARTDVTHWALDIKTAVSEAKLKNASVADIWTGLLDGAATSATRSVPKGRVFKVWLRALRSISVASSKVATQPIVTESTGGKLQSTSTPYLVSAPVTSAVLTSTPYKPVLIASATQPANASLTDRWLNTTTWRLNIKTVSGFVQCSDAEATALITGELATNASIRRTSSTAPTPPSPHYVWVNSSTTTIEGVQRNHGAIWDAAASSWRVISIPSDYVKFRIVSITAATESAAKTAAKTAVASLTCYADCSVLCRDSNGWSVFMTEASGKWSPKFTFAKAAVVTATPDAAYLVANPSIRRVFNLTDNTMWYSPAPNGVAKPFYQVDLSNFKAVVKKASEVGVPFPAELF
jgi:hypothetical protein